jgi:hypothetical protein
MADFTLDSVTDGADFLVWQRNVGRSSGATLRQGDATADGDVDGNDLAVWRARSEGLGARSEGGGEGAVSGPLSAVGQKGVGQGGALSREAATALAGVRKAEFGPGRRDQYERAIVRERDAAFASAAVVVGASAENTGGTPVARGAGDWSAAAVDAAIADDETGGDSFLLDRLAVWAGPAL